MKSNSFAALVETGVWDSAVSKRRKDCRLSKKEHLIFLAGSQISDLFISFIRLYSCINVFHEDIDQDTSAFESSPVGKSYKYGPFVSFYPVLLCEL